jgi:hypothetical protein
MRIETGFSEIESVRISGIETADRTAEIPGCFSRSAAQAAQRKFSRQNTITFRMATLF